MASIRRSISGCGAHSSRILESWDRNGHGRDRKQINIKIDHNFNASHKVAVNYSYDWINGDYGLTPGRAAYGTELQRRPQVLTVNFTSTLSPTLLNEARVGYRQNWHVIWAPWEVTDGSKREVPLSLLLEAAGFPIAYAPATCSAGMTPNNFICVTNCAQQGNTTPLYQYGDTLSWTKGKHAIQSSAADSVSDTRKDRKRLQRRFRKLPAAQD